MSEYKRGAEPDPFDQLAQGLSDIPVIPEHERPQWLRLRDEWSFLEERRKRYEWELTTNACKDNPAMDSSVHWKLRQLGWKQDRILEQLTRVPEARSWEIEVIRRSEYDIMYHNFILLPDKFAFRQLYQGGDYSHGRYSVVSQKEATSILEKMGDQFSKEAEIALHKKQRIDEALRGFEDR